MTNLPICLTLLVLFWAPCNSRWVGDACTADDQCKDELSFCRIWSPTCGSGTCSCIPGYSYYHNETRTCKDPKYSADSIKKEMPSPYVGYKCYDSAQCADGLYCRPYNRDTQDGGECNCRQDFKQVNKACEPKSIGDQCSTSDECRNTLYSYCVRGRCQCTTSYRQVKHRYMRIYGNMMRMHIHTSWACALGDSNYAQEGGFCNSTMKMAPGPYCRYPFVCLPCNKQHTCARIMPVFRSTSSVATGSTAVVALAASYITFML